MALGSIDVSQIDEIKFRCPNTRAFLKIATGGISLQQQSDSYQGVAELNKRSHLDLGEGELIVAINRLYWIKENSGGDHNQGQGLILDYVDISLHAVSRDFRTFPHKCIYMAVDQTYPEALSLVQSGQARIINLARQGDQRDEDDEEDDGQNLSTDMFFVPCDESNLDTIFRALSDCQALHPDPDDLGDSDNSSDEEITPGDIRSRRHIAEDTCRFNENLFESVDD